MLILVSRSRQEDSRNTCPYATPRKAQHTARTAVSGARVRILGVNPRSHEHRFVEFVAPGRDANELAILVEWRGY